MEEDDIHLFFTCNFARAAWFTTPWFIRSHILVLNCNSLTQLLITFLNMNHPHASLPNILTFMWCIWKSRNDNLFDRKPGSPHQVHHMAQAIRQNMEMLDMPQLALQQQLKPCNNITDVFSALQVDEQGAPSVPEQGETLKFDLQITGPKIFSHVAWKIKKIPGSQAQEVT